jgi:murein DD-endopeptidase MepM/ murein hydrolase activator NlpD
VIAGGAVVSAEGPPMTYKVKSGDTLEGVARKLDTTQKQLIDDNRLKKPYRLKLGQVLKGPASHGKAYVVQGGDTLYAIAHRFSVEASELADYNDIKVSAGLRPGKKLKLPPGFKDRGVPKPAAPPRPAPEREPPQQPYTPPYTPPVAPQPYTAPPQPQRPLPLTREPQEVPRTPTPVPGNPSLQPPSTPRPYAPPPANNGSLPSATPPLDDGAIANLGRGRFAWPVRGDVISGYGPKGGGLRNDGVDIRAGAGTPVQAAADGEVVYAGDQVPGFGNVVLIKHKDGWVTVYAHLARIDVKMRQQVSQGMQIGQVGNSGINGEPQLHFEVRYTPSPREKARAVNPGLVLPQ